jgi:peroxiredoxin
MEILADRPGGFTKPCLAILFLSVLVFAQQTVSVPNEQEKAIQQRINGLRGLPDDVRARTTRDLALQIRKLPPKSAKLALASSLTNLSTEGDFGRDTLQQVAATLADALRQNPKPPNKEGPADPYISLAQLVRYEHVQASLDDPQFEMALAKLKADDQSRQQADFTLADLEGKQWTLKDLRGKVVLVNFWATWCPPCRKELPDLQELYGKLRDQGLVILAISDEEIGKVKPFVVDQKLVLPVLLDPGRKVNERFRIRGIPKSFVYDRNGKIVAQAIDMRTRGQFLRMLAQAGLY